MKKESDKIWGKLIYKVEMLAAFRNSRPGVIRRWDPWIAPAFSKCFHTHGLLPALVR